MNLWDKVTGNDMTRAYRELEVRAKELPIDYRMAWERIKSRMWPYSDSTGRNLVPILGGVMGLLEETAAEGLDIGEVFGDDFEGFCSALVGGESSKFFRDKWRAQLNHNIYKKLGIEEDAHELSGND